MPQANKVMIQMHAVMAEWERDQISARTKAALAAAKARGVVLGATGPTNLKRCLEARKETADAKAAPLANMVRDMQGRKLSLRGMAAELNAMGVTASNGGQWSAVQVQRAMKRIAVGA
jgi:DNA invertase Pin-like site-specific DNA recombinase